MSTWLANEDGRAKICKQNKRSTKKLSQKRQRERFSNEPTAMHYVISKSLSSAFQIDQPRRGMPESSQVLLNVVGCVIRK